MWYQMTVGYFTGYHMPDVGILSSLAELASSCQGA
jgi:hypothetical protein